MLRRTFATLSKPANIAKRDWSVLCPYLSPPGRLSSEQVMKMESTYSAKNYSPMQVVFSSAKGCVITDPEGKEYFDFLAAYSAVNQGHCHPRLLKAMASQMEYCTLSSRAFYNNRFGQYAHFITRFFGYDRMLPMNTGAEACETALKMARRWGYEVKKIPADKAIIVTAAENFHGRTLACISMSTDPESYGNYGPKLPGLMSIPYDDVPALEKVLQENGDRIAAYIMEPIQGEAGVFVPRPGYYTAVRELCTKYNVLWIADEVQSGIGRAGKLLAVDYEEARPDVVTLGKALSGGLYPVSAVLADADVMGVFTPGTHGSTFGGNPLASVLGIESLKVLVEERMIENSFAMGEKFRGMLKEIQSRHPAILTAYRGRGLMNAIDLDESKDDHCAYLLCKTMLKNGLLAKPTHGKTVRLTPPLTINAEQIAKAADIIEKSIVEVETKLKY